MPSVPAAEIRRPDTLTDAERDEVDALRGRAASADGVGALSEQTVLALRSGTVGVRHAVAYAATRLVGYAQLDGPGADASAELVVEPGHRRRGVGGALLDAVLRESPSARVWAHGDLEAARALAVSRALQPVRELHKMARPLDAGDARSADTILPEGYTARSFEPGRDDA